MQRQQTLLICKQGSTGHITQNTLTVREDLVNHQTYSDTPRQTHAKSTMQQLQMCSSGCMRLTLTSAVWFAGCTSLLSSSVKALSLSPPCLSSVSFCWLASDHGEPKGWGSSCWTSLGTSILLYIPLEKKRGIEYCKRGVWITSCLHANRKLKTDGFPDIIFNLLTKTCFSVHPYIHNASTLAINSANTLIWWPYSL